MNNELKQRPFERAVIVAMSAHDERFPVSPMTTLVDRPIIQHVIERLCGEGVRHIDVVAPDRELALRHFACDSERWGAHFRWLGVSNSNIDLIREAGHADRVLIAFANVLPLHSLADHALQNGIVAALRSRPDGEHAPAWYAADATAMETMPHPVDTHDVCEWLDTLAETSVPSQSALVVQTMDGLLSSQRQLLSQNGPTLPGDDSGIRLIGQEPSPGVRICRNVKIHPSVVIVGPVFIGDNTRIGKHAKLGPNTVIGPNCIVDHHARVSNSLVAERSYLGPWIDVADCIVERTNVTNVRLGAQVNIDDPLLLSRV